MITVCFKISCYFREFAETFLEFLMTTMLIYYITGLNGLSSGKACIIIVKVVTCNVENGNEAVKRGVFK